MKLVTVTPAGRRRYLEVLVPYLLRNREVIAEHHWWLNTRDPHDLAYLHRLVDKHPDFFRLVVEPMDRTIGIGHQIWRYMRHCDDADTVYLRLDDDICFVDEGAIRRIYEHRLANPAPFLVMGLIVNNAVSTHFYQRTGVVPAAWGEVAMECMDDVGWKSARFAKRLHDSFLADLRRGDIDRWRGVDTAFDGLRRYSINAICWKGEDMALVEDRYQTDRDEEPFLTADMPRRLGRPAVVCADALFAHYAFYTQRKYLDKAAPELLDAYRRIALAGDAQRVVGPGLARRAGMTLYRNSGRLSCAASAALRSAKRLAKRLSTPAPPEAAPLTSVDAPSSRKAA